MVNALLPLAGYLAVDGVRLCGSFGRTAFSPPHMSYVYLGYKGVRRGRGYLSPVLRTPLVRQLGGITASH